MDWTRSSMLLLPLRQSREPLLKLGKGGAPLDAEDLSGLPQLRLERLLQSHPLAEAPGWSHVAQEACLLPLGDLPPAAHRTEIRIAATSTAIA